MVCLHLQADTAVRVGGRELPANAVVSATRDEVTFNRVASAIVCDGVSTAAVVFGPEYGNEDAHQI
jgi:hypothetical protein